MGILNVTPDSFSEHGINLDPAIAAEAAFCMADEGADIIDIGGESTRPGRPEAVDVDEELRRVLPVLQQIRRELPKILISVDTSKGEVAAQCLDAGADIINDIYALQRSPEIASHIARHEAGLILMHMLGDPENMQENPEYRRVLVDVKEMLLGRMHEAVRLGIPEECIAVDPGIGFGKTIEHNLRLIAGLEYLRLLQRPVCIGLSRKAFLGKITGGAPAEDREEATIAANCAAIMNGASIIRVHNVKAARRAALVMDQIRAHQ
jgi:dihydropteroate synthase